MIHSKNVSSAKTTAAMSMEAKSTTIALCVNSRRLGQVVLCANSEYESLQYLIIRFMFTIVLAREERLELPTPGFGDQCSTN